MAEKARILQIDSERRHKILSGRMFTVMGYQQWMSAEGLSSATIRQRTWFVEARLKEWGTLDVPAHQIGDWLRGFNGHSQRTYLTHLRSAYRFMVESEFIDDSPVRRLKLDAVPDPRPSPLSSAELDAVLGAARGHLRSWILLGYLAGLRSHEMAKVRGEDMDETAFYVLGKGRKAAVLPTHPALWALAQQYPRVGYWFPSPQARREFVSTSHVENSIRALFRSVGVETGAGHRLRHSYATSMARAGAQPRVVQVLMRHSQLNTTMRYLGVDEDEKRAAVRTLVA